mmetsp:Transcript_29510/g.47997  ORF Transcript_29510/g.47997 Transcript_29510/m.47997 type:complete len:416 (-) Transcript_29510:186-1433(-)
MALREMLGETLLSKDGEVQTDSALQGKVVGLYFSAHWCPPCKGFTPVLAEIYNGYKAKGKNFEVVFVSSDRDQGSFDGYYGEMPWLALPFSDRDRKTHLSSKFKVRGIPSLVILDEDGSLITLNGRASVQSDREGEDFPWRPKPIPELLGDEFKGKEGTVGRSVIEGKTLGIYFSAHWCGPCRGFTPTLAKVYNKLKEKGQNNFEVIFVSGDKSDSQFEEYYGEMPWLAIPYGDKRIDQLNQRFEVNGIPHLVILNPDGTVLNASARGKIDADENAENFPWAPEPMEDLGVTAECMGSDINEKPSLVLFMEGVDDLQQDEAWAAGLAVAREFAARGGGDGPAVLFFGARGGGRIPPRVRRMTGLPEQEEKISMVVLDIPDSGGYYKSDAEEINEQTVRDFAENYKTLATRQQLSR